MQLLRHSLALGMVASFMVAEMERVLGSTKATPFSLASACRAPASKRPLATGETSSMRGSFFMRSVMVSTTPNLTP